MCIRKTVMLGITTVLATIWIATPALADAVLPTASASPAQTEHSGYRGSVTFASAQPMRPADSQARGVSVSCTDAPDTRWQLSRFTSCWRAGLTYTARDVRTGAPVGGANFTINQNTELNPNGTDWSENATLTMDEHSAWGAVTTMLATWTASCGSSCKTNQAEPFPAGSPLIAGTSLNGSMSFSNPQAKGTADSFQTGYVLELVSPGSLSDAPVRYGAPPLRCDKQVGSTAGCVVSVFTPTFNVDRAEFPLAATGVEWAQNNLPGSPGKPGAGQPLHRLADRTRQRANRTRVCETGWTPSSDVPNDSCDEFPFAATIEGGSMAGPDCAEITPQSNGGTAVTRPGNSGTTCVRAHVPLRQNTDVGADLGTFVQEQRVLDAEAYWVTTR